MGKILVNIAYLAFCLINIGLHVLFIIWVAKHARCKKSTTVTPVEPAPNAPETVTPVKEMTKEEIVVCLQTTFPFLEGKRWQLDHDDTAGYLLTVTDAGVKKIYKVIPFARTRKVSLQHFATTTI